MDRTKKRALWVAPESTFATDPSADGSGYLHIPAIDVGLLKDDLTQLDTNYMTGRNHPTAPIAGPDGWSIDVTTPMIGLTAAAAASTPPSATEDWFGTLIKHILGSVSQVTGRAVSSMASTSAITFASDLFNIQSLLCLYEAGLPSAGNGVRSQWSMVTVDPADGTYTLSPALQAQCTSAAVAYGQSLYLFTNTSPATLAFSYLQDSVVYTLLGGRCTAMSITAPAREKVQVKFTFSGDSKTLDAGKTALPTGVACVNTPIKGLLSPVWIGSTKYACKSVSFDMGIAAVVDDSTEAINGRAAYEQLAIAPKVTIEPAYASGLQDLKRAATAGNPLLIQFGSGALANAKINSCAIHLGEAVAVDAQPMDDAGRLRLNLQFMATDKGIFSGTTLARHIQFARA